MDTENTIYSRLQEVYFQSAANLIINSFKFPKFFPNKIIHFLYSRDFIKRKYDKNYVDICAIKNNEVIGIMRAKYSKNIWTINTNCVNKHYTKEKPFLWIKIMLFLANEILKNSNETTVSFSASQPAIAKIGAKYAMKNGFLIVPIINRKNVENNNHYYKISKALRNV